MSRSSNRSMSITACFGPSRASPSSEPLMPRRDETSDTDSDGEHISSPEPEGRVFDLVHDAVTPDTTVHNNSGVESSIPPVRRRRANTRGPTISATDYRRIQRRLRESIFNSEESDRLFDPYDPGFDKCPRPCLAAYEPKNGHQTSNSLTRHNCVEEIMTQQNNYVDVLIRLHDGYMMPLKINNILSDGKIRRIFQDLKGILQLERSFQMYLLDLCAQWQSDEQITPTFESFFQKENVLRYYRDYVMKYKDIVEVIKLWSEKKKVFGAFMEERSREDKLMYSGLFIRPVQRFPQIKMTIEKLLKHTPENHPDWLILHRALIYVQRLANVVNEYQRDSEARAETTKLLEELKITPNVSQIESLRLIRSDHVTECTQSPHRISRRLILLNRSLFVVSPRDNRGGGSRVVCELIENVSIGRDALSRSVSFDSDRLTLDREIQQMENDDGMLSDIFHKIERMTVIGKNAMPIRGLENARRTIRRHLVRKVNEKNRSSHPYVFIAYKGKETKKYCMQDSVVKKEWLQDFTIAKLMSESRNCKLWHSSGESDNVSNQGLPLFVGHKPTEPPPNKRRLYCAVVFNDVVADHAVKHIWCCGEAGFISVLTVSSDHVTLSHSFSVEEEDFNCVEAVPTIDDTAVWMAQRSGKILIHSVSSKHRNRTKHTIVTGSTVSAIKYLDNNVYVSLKTGDILIYCHNTNAEPDYNNQTRIECYEPITHMACFEERIFAASGTRILKIHNKLIVKEFQLIKPTRQPTSQVNATLPSESKIQHFVVCHEGFWFSCRGEMTLRFWHVTQQELQKLDLESCFRSLNSEEQLSKFSVTAIILTDEQLWVGSSNGVIFLINLQHSQCCPLAVGPTLISRYKHNPEVDCMIAVENVNDELLIPRCCTSSSSCVLSPILPNRNNDGSNSDVNTMEVEMTDRSSEDIFEFDNRSSPDLTSAATSQSQADILDSMMGDMMHMATECDAQIDEVRRTSVTTSAESAPDHQSAVSVFDLHRQRRGRRTTFILTFGAGYSDFEFPDGFLDMGFLQWRRDFVR